jgi:hypothetical protein
MYITIKTNATSSSDPLHEVNFNRAVKMRTRSHRRPSRQHDEELDEAHISD